MSWIETYTGKKFYPLNPRPGDVSIIDIAHSLSMQCRFNGHTRLFYSVAEHSIIVSKELAAAGYGWILQLYGLLHDAAEAYVCDLPRPIKNQIKEYRPIEAKIQEVIWQAFNLSSPTEQDRKTLQEMDDRILGYEGVMLMHNVEARTAKLPYYRLKASSIMGLSEIVAEDEFLALFHVDNKTSLVKNVKNG
jgi:hypothetical protein